MTQEPETAQDEATFLIPEPNVERFRKKLNVLTKRAKKLGLAALSAADLGEHVERVKVTGPGGVETHIEYRYRKILVTGERPKLNGWKLLGTIAHEAGGNIFSNAPGEEIPESYRDTPNVCDHCKTKRQRRDTMIIEKGGEVRQIGRNCLQDFIGDVNVKGITMYYETWPSLADFVGGMGGGVSRDYVPAPEYMAAVACAIRHYGFVSSTTARLADPDERVTSTKSMAWSVLFPSPQLRGADRPPMIEKEDRDAAAEILAWIVDDLGQRDLVGYLANLRAACSGGWIRFKHSGLAASAFRARENDIIGQQKADERRQAMADRRRKWAEEDTNEHFGEIKQKAVWTLKVLKMTDIDGNYGPYTRILFKDQDGRMASWDTTSATQVERLEKGKTYLVEATVKKHITWNNDNATRCTILTRANVKGEVVEEDAG